MRGARKSGVINIFLVSRSMGSEGWAVLELEMSVPESEARESAMIAWTVHSQTAGKACQCQTCRQSKIAACAALQRVPKLINPQLWMARHNICTAHFDLAMLSLRRAFSSLKSTRTCGLFRLRQVLAVHRHKKRRRPIVRVSSGAILFIKADMSPSKKLIIGNFGHCVAISVKGKPVLKTMAS